MSSAVTGAANSAPGKALLVPAATALGKYWGERMEELTHKWRERRRRNVEDYHAKVIEVEGTTAEKDPTERQARLILQWAETSQEVDYEEDPELVPLWASVLGSIYRKDADSRELMDVVKRLSPSDARALFELGEEVDSGPKIPRFFVGTMADGGCDFGKSAKTRLVFSRPPCNPRLSP